MLDPELSIIVAASNLRETLEPYMAALEPQLAGRRVEVLLAGAAGDSNLRAARNRFPWLVTIEADRRRLIPELWGLGVARALGRIVAVTVTSCVPGPGWVEAVIRGHRAAHAAIGGAIENAPDATWLDWAIYFVRYTPYMLPVAAGSVAEIPGDNGTYKREAIADQMDTIAASGFWEADVNASLRRKRQTLWIDPALTVFHRRSFTFGEFTRQRFQHGRVFGRGRAATAPVSDRLLHGLMVPVVPALMLTRIFKTVIARRRHIGRCVVSLPLTAWFLACWAAGEWVGYVASPSAPRAPLK